MEREYYRLAANIVTHLRGADVQSKIGHGHLAEGEVVDLVESILIKTLHRGDSLMIHVPDANRGALLTALATMPDEAFGWFVVWATGVNVQYPDGLGGFSDESQASIQALRTAAHAL